ncbi:MAG: DNA-binding transcriptional regulator [Pirellulales bacterium]|nr:DNA-binding transcriptional regulator [Pirellulales bacterium]
MGKRLRIALLIESSRAYGRELERGIASYVREHGPWTVFQHERRLYDALPAWLKRWEGDGIIARIGNAKIAEQIRRKGLPTVDLLGLHKVPGVPAILTDHRTVAHVAADHLLERGLAHFAYCGAAGVFFSQRRCEYFAEYLKKRGHKTHVYSGPTRRQPDASYVEVQSLPSAESLAAWIESLPKPVGLMACNDIRAQHVLSVCGQYGFAVPDEVAVIGVDNDDVLCDLCDPPLSSVAKNARKTGYEAASMLDRMIQGHRPRRMRTLVAPLGVVSRRSTDFVAVGDVDLAAAVRFIREHACDGIDIDAVVECVQLSRSTLKRRFADVLRRSPSEEIRRVRIARVKELLTTTSYPLFKIATLAGFKHVESMCKLFKNSTGRTPGQYRQEWQL